MKAKILVESRFRVVAVMDGDDCPVEDFLTKGEKSTEAHRSGLYVLMERAANEGLQALSSAQFHEVDKNNGIYEFIKGPLRLFCFKGSDGVVAVCTDGARKQGQKVDKAAVQSAIRTKADYLSAQQNEALEFVREEDDEDETQ